MAEPDPPFADEAAEALRRALAATDNLERERWLEEALRLHRLARTDRGRPAAG